MRTLLFLSLASLICINALGQQTPWVKGCYYDLKGNKISGQISRQRGAGGYLLFKTNDNNQRKIPSSAIKAYVTPNDSFVVSHVAYLQKSPFLRVVINSPLKMYVSRQMITTAGFNHTIDVYYYGSNPDNLTGIKTQNFFDAMDKLLAAKPQLLAKIKRKEYTFDDMEEIVIDYNGKSVGANSHKEN